MHHPAELAADSPAAVEDALNVALDLVARGEIDGICRAIGIVRSSGLHPADDGFQSVIVEIAFQMLERLDRNIADADVPLLLCELDRDVAALALDLLVSANFADGIVRMNEIADSTALLIAGLTAAAGDREAAKSLLAQANAVRANMPFSIATTQFLYLMHADSGEVIQTLLAQLLDGLDHPETWPALPAVVRRFPDIVEETAKLVDAPLGLYAELWTLAHALFLAARGETLEALSRIEPIAIAHSQSALVQGAYFHIKSLLDRDNALYDLTDKFCSTPFDVLDVLDGKSHLCCASWLTESVGDLATSDWREVWNSDTAQAIRASIHDGSYRFCNKTACPKIAGNSLPTKAQAAAVSEQKRDIVERRKTLVDGSPYRVNLAYDMTCNLSCPSCRTSKIAADSATRARFDKLQEEAILPMLRGSKLVFITGSGDPFASKNFRSLIERLGPDDYPELRFQIMTNGMLFTRKEWDRFPSLHGRTAHLRISLDAATGPTHELLRRGARWPVMLENLAFAAELRAANLVERLDFAFAVQADNFREMGDFVDMAHHYGADHIGFLRLTNWGTFTSAEYASKAIFMPSHPDHAEFLEVMCDPRLRDPIATLNDLSEFLPKSAH